MEKSEKALAMHESGNRPEQKKTQAPQRRRKVAK
jgi:hypothetical protein